LAKIYAPNKEYTGVSAFVSFIDGVGETDDLHLIQWFERNGYTIEGKDSEPAPTVDDEPTLESMSATDLRDLAREKGIKGYSNMTKDQLIKALEVE
jgi:hypothetical protein